jgi:ABC-type glycerol-3-phosphate transport system permease component
MRAIVGSAVTHLVIIAGGLIVMIPFFWMISTSLKHEWEAFQIPPRWIPDEFVWSNYWRAVFQYFNFARYAANTLIITLGVLLGRLISASMVAFGFARIRFIGRDVLFMLVLSTLMVPHQVTIIPLYILFKEVEWLNTFLPLIVPAWAGGGAFFIFLLRQFIMTINPELDDAARIDGCGWLGLYWRIILPLIKPALASVAIFSFLGTWNDFFNPLIFLRSNDLFTLAIGLHFYTSAASAATRPETTVVMAGATIVMVPPLLLFFLAQSYFIQGVVFTGSKG